jgi:hypothetical protein
MRLNEHEDERRDHFADEADQVQPPKRPLFLDKILKTTAHRDSQDQQLYQQFLSNAYSSQQMNSNSLRVTFSWTYAHDPIPNYYNCSLCAIFFFYTKVQLPTTKLHVRSSRLTSDEENLGRSCLSMYELFLLLRDFRIVPKLISKEEVLFLWKLITSMKKSRREEVVLLEFHDFQELFARIAILTFSKPMIQRILSSTHQQQQKKLLSYEEQILALANYLHLDDYQWVKNRLQTVSTHTVSLINARSKNELNPLRKEWLRDEIKGKRIANWLAQGDLNSASSGGHVNIEQMKTILESTYRNSQATSTTTASQSKYKKSQEQESNTSPTLLEQMINQLKAEGLWPLEDEADDTDPATTAYNSSSKAIQYSSENHLFSHSTLPPNQSTLPSPSGAPLHTPSLLLLGGIKLSQTQEDALVQYLPNYTRVLDRYSDLQAYTFHRSTQSHPEREARGNDIGMLDMGTLEEDREVIVRMHITNQTGYEMNIEINVEHMAPVEIMRVTSLPEPLAPGLSKTAYLTYTIPVLTEKRRNFLFHITVHGISTQALNNTIHAVRRGESGVIPHQIRSKSAGISRSSIRKRTGQQDAKETSAAATAVVSQEFPIFSRIFPEELFRISSSGETREEGSERQLDLPRAAYQTYPHCTSESLERLYHLHLRNPQQPTSLLTPQDTIRTDKSGPIPSRPLQGSPKKSIIRSR